MKTISAPSLAQRLLGFAFSRATWLVFFFSIFGIFLAVQSKQTLSLKPDFPNIRSEISADGAASYLLLPAIRSYDGPVSAEIFLSDISSPTNISFHCDDIIIGSKTVQAAAKASIHFDIPAGSFTTKEGLMLTLEAEDNEHTAISLDDFILQFPKAGYWIFPGWGIWFGVSFISLLFGLLCCLMWDKKINVISSFAGSSLAITIACHIGGIAMMWRLSKLVFAVGLLLLAALFIRGLIFRSKTVMISSQ
jgi:hypothetical protein